MSNSIKNPFSDNSENPAKGREIDWLKWNQNARSKSNPYIDSNGDIIEGMISEFSSYRKKLQELYQEDLNKLPSDIKQDLENNTRLFSERMQVEATGHR